MNYEKANNFKILILELTKNKNQVTFSTLNISEL